MLARDFFAELDELALGHAFEMMDRRDKCILETAEVQQVASHHVAEVENLLGGDLPVPQPLQEHVLDRVGRYDGAVEVEERSRRLAAHARGNFPGEVFIGLHWDVSVCCFGRRQNRKFTMPHSGLAFNTYCPCLSTASTKRKIAL